MTFSKVNSWSISFELFYKKCTKAITLPEGSKVRTTDLILSFLTQVALCIWETSTKLLDNID
jgi:hypothetical protein